MEVITQKEERNPISGGRSIVLDIFAKDSEGKNYDVEVQCNSLLYSLPYFRNIGSSMILLLYFPSLFFNHFCMVRQEGGIDFSCGV